MAKATVVFEAGNHKASEGNFFHSHPNVKGIEGTIALNESFLYKITKPVQKGDQEDWIKLVGFYYIRRFWDQWIPNKNNVIIAYRNSHKFGGPQVCFYRNKSNATFKPKKLEWDITNTVNIENINTPIRFQLLKGNLKMIVDGKTHELSNVEVPKHKKIKFLNPWFGGTSPAPKDMSFELDWAWKF